MKILTTQQIRELDAYTIAHEPVASIDLMERACFAFTTWFSERFDATRRIGVVCGSGNNGGDGLGIARLLKERGYSVYVWIVGGTRATADFEVNRRRLPAAIPVTELTQADEGGFNTVDVLIDALFGSGLSRAPEGLYASVIQAINQAGVQRVAVDIPSGLLVDKPGQEPVVRAHYTVSFQLPKLAFMLPQYHAFTGEWVLVDIGLSKAFIRDAESSYEYVEAKQARRLLKVRSKFDHKGTYGHALLVAGSYGKIGAAVLSSRAVLRAGAGLLTTHVPRCGYSIIQTAVPEAMVLPDTSETMFTACPADLDRYTALGIGPGLGQARETAAALAETLEKFAKPTVIDADALNILAQNSALLHVVPPGSILTPHPKEFERLVGTWANDFDRLDKQRQLAARLKAVVVLKGANTSVVTPQGKVFFNSTGNPGMATGGTGDVLTGILTGLLAQKYSPEDAAVLGVFLHGLAGDHAAYEKGMHSLIASDLTDFLSSAYRQLQA